MRGRFALVFGLILVAAGVWLWRSRGGAPDEPAITPAPTPVAAAPRPAPEPRRPGRVAARPDRDWLEAAKELMEDGVEGSCGPYRVISDAADPELLCLCDRLASPLDATYRLRFGLDPVGDPQGAVLLFADRDDFRRFSVEVAGLAAGYAGFSRSARGIVALHAEVAAADFATTLAHELTHLVNRRALGPDLPPWLAEGLADAVGDTATPAGIVELAGFDGVEAQAERLAGAYATDRAAPLARLAALDRSGFDRGAVSYDYEQSALLVRMLLTSPDLRDGFRRFLNQLAAGRGYEPSLLPRELGLAWADLDRRLADWLAG